MLRQGAAVLIIIMGLFMTGWIKIPLLLREYRPFQRRGFGGIGGAFLLGCGFTLGWTPCTGPILAAIFIYAGSRATVVEGLWLLGFYVLGFALPFFVLALLWQRLEKRVRTLYRFLPAVQKVAGVSLVALGVMMWFGWTMRFMGWLSGLVPFSF